MKNLWLTLVLLPVCAEAARIDYQIPAIAATGSDTPLTLANTFAAMPVNVNFCGAFGLGVSDEHVNIQKCLTEYDNVYFPPGTYLTNTTLQYHSKQKITGEGRLSIIKLANSANTDILAASEWVANTTTQTQGPVIRDLHIDGNKANNSSGNCLVVYAWRSWIENVEVQDCPGTAFLHTATTSNGSAGTGNSQENRFVGIYSRTGAARAFYASGGVTDAWVLGSTFNGNGSSSLAQFECDTTSCAGFHIIGNKAYSGKSSDFLLGGRNLIFANNNVDNDATDPATNNFAVKLSPTAAGGMVVEDNVIRLSSSDASGTKNYFAIGLALNNNPASLVVKNNRVVAEDTGLSVKFALRITNSGTVSNVELKDNNLTGFADTEYGNAFQQVGVAKARTASSTDTTPSVAGADLLYTANASTTLISALDDGALNQTVTIIIGDANTTLDCTASSLVCNGGVDYATSTGDRIACVFDGTTWKCNVPRAIPKYPSAAFASLPAAASNTGITYQVTNVRNALFYSDGTNWNPVGGGALLYQKSGSVASPLATISGTTAASFSISGGDPTIPLGLLRATSKIHVEALVKKNGANATANLQALVGTADTSADASMGTQVITIGDGSTARLFQDGWFSSTTNFIGLGTSVPNQSNSNATFTDRSTNVNTAAVMFVSFRITSGNASDTYDLLAVSVVVWP